MDCRNRPATPGWWPFPFGGDRRGGLIPFHILYLMVVVGKHVTFLLIVV